MNKAQLIDELSEMREKLNEGMVDTISVARQLFVPGPGPERGIVFQSYTLFPWLTVQQNVEFGPRLRRTPPAPCSPVSPLPPMSPASVEPVDPSRPAELVAAAPLGDAAARWAGGILRGTEASAGDASFDRP